MRSFFTFILHFFMKMCSRALKMNLKSEHVWIIDIIQFDFFNLNDSINKYCQLSVRIIHTLHYLNSTESFILFVIYSEPVLICDIRNRYEVYGCSNFIVLLYYKLCCLKLIKILLLLQYFMILKRYFRRK